MLGLLCSPSAPLSPFEILQSRNIASSARNRGSRRGNRQKSQTNRADEVQGQIHSTIAARTAIKGKRSQLHDELMDFAWRCSPTPASVKLAELSTRAIELAWTRATEHPPIVAAPFGSQPCAMALPGGDLDVSVYISAATKKSAKKLKARQLLLDLHSALKRTQTFPGASQYISARVPIVTGSVVGGMRVDISSREKNDTVAEDGVALMQACLDAQPQARPLLLALKALVKQEGLNKVFTGGFSSFTLFNMVCGLLQHQAVHFTRGDETCGFLPDLHKLPSQSQLARMQYSHLPPKYLPDPSILREEGPPRFSYCVVHAAGAPWHLPHHTPLEMHASTQGLHLDPQCSSEGLFNGSDGEGLLQAWDEASDEGDRASHEGQQSVSELKQSLAVKHLAFVREAVKEGPDLGDLFLDVLNRYGSRWSRGSDSVHLRRMDPFSSEEPLGDEDMMDMDAFLSDMGFLSDADESDKEMAMRDQPQSKGNKKGPKEKKGKKGGGNVPRWAKSSQWDGDADYCILSPFQSESTADVNLAGGSSQGRRFRKCLETSATDLVQATIEWGKRVKNGRQARKERRAAEATVHAVVAYLGQLTEVQRDTVLRECELAVMARPDASKLRTKAANLEGNLKQARKTLRGLQNKIKEGKAPKNIAVKVNKRISKQRSKMEEWEKELQALMAGTEPCKPPSLLNADTSDYKRWGAASSKGSDGDEISLKMHGVADGIAEALLEIKEHEIVHKYAQAAAHWTKEKADVKQHLESAPELTRALQDLCVLHGPSSTEIWLSDLRQPQLDAVIDFAEWALQGAVSEEVFGCQPDIIHINRVDLQTQNGTTTCSVPWKWERARIAVQPDRAYPVLGSVLNIRKALDLPDVALRARPLAKSVGAACSQQVDSTNAGAEGVAAHSATVWVHGQQDAGSAGSELKPDNGTSGRTDLQDLVHSMSINASAAHERLDTLAANSSTTMSEDADDLDVRSNHTDDGIGALSQISTDDESTAEALPKSMFKEFGVEDLGHMDPCAAQAEGQGSNLAKGWAHKQRDSTTAIEEISVKFGPKRYLSSSRATDSEESPGIGVEEQMELLARKEQQL